MWTDLKYALRVLRRSRGFLLMAVITSAIAIAANTAVFSIINAVLLSPLGGVRNAAGLVLVTRELRSKSYDNFSYPDYLDLRDRSQTLTGLAATCATPLSFRSTDPIRLRAELVSGNYFSVLGVAARLGRLILAEDDVIGSSQPVAVLSFDLWQKQFGLDPSVVGKSIFLNGNSFTVIGVADPRFQGSSSIQAADVWVPIASQPQTIPRLSRGVLQDRNSKWLDLFGRLASHIQIKQAGAEVNVMGQQLEAQYPAANEGRLGVAAGLGLDPDDRTSLQGFLARLQAASALLLIVACSNVAGLFLIRARSRRREVAIRQALGAGFGALVRQFLIEGLLLAFASAAMGLLMTPWLTRLILLISPPYYNLVNASAGYDLKVVSLAVALAIGLGGVFGLVPALASSSRRVAKNLKDASVAAGRRRGLVQDLLIAFQVAVSLLLVAGTGLIVRSVQNVLSLDRGFDDKGVVLSSIDLSIQGYAEPSGRQLYESVLNRIRSIPGVESASLAKTVPPYDWSDRVSIFHEGEQPTLAEYKANWELGLRVDADRVAPDYFRTMGIPLLAGQDFNIEDRPESSPVAIISQGLAERLWPGQSAIGRPVVLPSESGSGWRTIKTIGIAKEVRYRSLTAEPPYLIYLPESQNYDGRATLIVRSVKDPQAIVPAVRAEVARLDPDLPLYRCITMSQQIADSLWQQRMAEWLLAAVALVALALAGIGLYCVVAHYASERKREFGIRIALGATGSDVVRLMLRRAATLAAGGICAGLAVSPVLVRLLDGGLYSVTAYNPPILMASALVVGAVVWWAGLLPARRAGRTDPMEVMRCE